MLKKCIIKPLILFLLLSQFSTLAHAIEHQLENEEHEQCLICIHEVDSKNLLIENTKTVSLHFFSEEKINSKSCFFNLTKPSLYNIRSPPILLI
ncbi:MAG: hypothetical protein D8M62_11205 [Proteobacteria bacterium]|nr:hypothetical protein [Pseudomonadota bacterium]